MVNVTRVVPDAAGAEITTAVVIEGLERVRKSIERFDSAGTRVCEAIDFIRHQQAEIDKLQRFKTWVHEYLDSHGVPHHPPGTHGAAGCRIGDRMDWVWEEIDKLRAENADLRERCGET